MSDIHVVDGNPKSTYWTNNSGQPIDAKNLNEIEDVLQKAINVSDWYINEQSSLDGITAYFVDSDVSSLTNDGQIVLQQLEKMLSKLQVIYDQGNINYIALNSDEPENRLVTRSYVDQNFVSTLYNHGVSNYTGNLNDNDDVEFSKISFHIDNSSSNTSFTNIVIKFTKTDTTSFSITVDDGTNGINFFDTIGNDLDYVDINIEAITDVNPSSALLKISAYDVKGDNLRSVVQIVPNIVLNAHSYEIKGNSSAISTVQVLWSDNFPGSTEVLYPLFEEEQFEA